MKLFKDNTLLEFITHGLNQAGAIGIAQTILEEYMEDAECCGSDCNLNDFKQRLIAQYEQAPYDEYDEGLPTHTYITDDKIRDNAISIIQAKKNNGG